MFDSTSVEHEVLPTCKERWAVVGWFLIDKEITSERVDAKDGGKKRCLQSGEDQTDYSKKTKKLRERGQAKNRST